MLPVTHKLENVCCASLEITTKQASKKQIRPHVFASLQLFLHLKWSLKSFRSSLRHLPRARHRQLHRLVYKHVGCNTPVPTYYLWLSHHVAEHVDLFMPQGSREVLEVKVRIDDMRSRAENGVGGVNVAAPQTSDVAATELSRILANSSNLTELSRRSCTH